MKAINSEKTHGLTKDLTHLFDQSPPTLVIGDRIEVLQDKRRHPLRPPESQGTLCDIWVEGDETVLLVYWDDEQAYEEVQLAKIVLKKIPSFDR